MLNARPRSGDGRAKHRRQGSNLRCVHCVRTVISVCQCPDIVSGHNGHTDTAPKLLTLKCPGSGRRGRGVHTARSKFEIVYYKDHFRPYPLSGDWRRVVGTIDLVRWSAPVQLLKYARRRGEDCLVQKRLIRVTPLTSVHACAVFLRGKSRPVTFRAIPRTSVRSDYDGTSRARVCLVHPRKYATRTAGPF
jgi:hypothetical protein